MTTDWTAAHIASIVDPPRAPPIGRDALTPILPGFDLWDWWPVQDEDGAAADIAGGMLCMLLSAPAALDPDARHAHARIRLMHRVGERWTDLGPLLPDGFSPGSREWSGCAVLNRAGDAVTLHFTAAGRRGEGQIGYEQRLFETRARLEGLRLVDWTPPVETVAADGCLYETDMTGGGGIGTIKAFRDPAWFRDPADGREYLFFAGSRAGSASAWNGVVGVAVRDGARWRLAEPLVSAEGLNNELERPHIVHHQGRYYLFWSTQAKVFAQGGPAGPNGLYAMVADRVTGPYRAVNGSGLVFANPESAPFQAYSWWVLADLSVHGFADMIGIGRPPADAHEARAHFGGVPSPTLQLVLDGDRAWLA